jgi:hypothetical protein
MFCQRLIAAAFLVGAALGCHNSGIKVQVPDGGGADVMRPADVAGPDLWTVAGPDAVAAMDVFLPGPDTSPTIPDAKSVDLFVGKDLAPTSDNASGPDTSSDLAADTLPPQDLMRTPDLAVEVLLLPPETVDAKAPSAEEASDLATDTPSLPKDVIVYTNKDLVAGADAKCVAAAPGWLSVVSTFLAEDQKCWADSDCTYVSFSDACGMICVLPMNQQRIGEFGNQVYGYASANCGTCPSPTTFPTCPAPTTVYCNAGRCAYKGN